MNDLIEIPAGTVVEHHWGADVTRYAMPHRRRFVAQPIPAHDVRVSVYSFVMDGKSWRVKSTQVHVVEVNTKRTMKELEAQR
jgi:hypothetical protein